MPKHTYAIYKFNFIYLCEVCKNCEMIYINFTPHMFHSSYIQSN